MASGVFQDSRFVTHNTNLAACLGALKIPLKNVTNDKGERYADYVRRIEDADTGKVTVYWCFEDEGRDYKAREIESHWAHRDRFEADEANGTHPLIPMRLALEKLEWATKVWWGNIVPQVRHGEVLTRTRDIGLAACLLALGHDLLSFDKSIKEFGFGFVNSTVLEAYVNYRNWSHHIATMRLVIEVRKLLLAELKRPDLVTQVHYKNGDPLNGGKEMLIIKGQCTEEQLNLLLEKFYE